MVGSEFPILGQYLAISWKRYAIGPWLLLNVNRKSWVPDRSMSAPMTLNDLQIGSSFSGVSAYVHARTV